MIRRFYQELSTPADPRPCAWGRRSDAATDDRAAGAEGRYADQLPQLLDALREQARVESITASSAIEGVVVDNARSPGSSWWPGVLRNRSEAEFAGYSSALDYLNQEDPGELSVGLSCTYAGSCFFH